MCAGTKKGRLPLSLYGIQLALNLIWQPLMFKLHRTDLALADAAGAQRGHRAQPAQLAAPAQPPPLRHGPHLGLSGHLHVHGAPGLPAALPPASFWAHELPCNRPMACCALPMLMPAAMLGMAAAASVSMTQAVPSNRKAAGADMHAHSARLLHAGGLPCLLQAGQRLQACALPQAAGARGLPCA